METLAALAKALGVSTAELIGDAEVDQPADPRTPEQIAQEEAEKKIDAALADDDELIAFWNELKKRDDLQLLFRQVRPMAPRTIKKVIKVIKAIEEAEEIED